jgi:glycosyltransferase involved in cell wall biosynthesis
MNKRLKIIHLSISDAKGGAAIAAFRLHQLMNKDSQLESKMLVLIKNTNCDMTFWLNGYVRMCARCFNLINNILCAFKKNKGVFSFAIHGNNLYSNDLIKKADVIYIHWANSGMLSWRNITKLFSLNKPIFLFCHDMWYFTGGCHHGNTCVRYTEGCSICPFFNIKYLQKYIGWQYVKKKQAYKLNNNAKLILPSPDFYNKAKESHIIEKSRIYFIPNILDINKYIPKKINKSNKKQIRILYGALGGKTNPYKGWKDFEYFATRIIDKKYDRSIEFALFGYDFSQIEINEIPFKFINYGTIYEEEEIIEMYQNADVFIFPSNQESYGQTLVESMSCGVIPIAYKVGIANYLIKNNENGYMVDIGDKEGLVLSFNNLINNDILTLKVAARKTVTDKLSTDIVMDMHRNLILSSL